MNDAETYAQQEQRAMLGGIERAIIEKENWFDAYVTIIDHDFPQGIN